MSLYRLVSHAACGLLLVSGGLLTPALMAEDGGEGANRRERSGGGMADFEVRRKFRTAEQLLESKEYDRAVAALENLVEQFPESDYRYRIWLTLGRHYLKDKHDQKQALDYLLKVEDIADGRGKDDPLRGDDLDTYLEGRYLTGVSYYEMKQYDKCFPILRSITTQHPNSIWSNQSFYYIGMAHFVQKNWGKAIKYLSLVGTYVDPEAETAKYVEAGRRLYLKVEDGDLPILQRLSKLASAEVVTANGDRANLDLFPLSLRENLFIATIATEVGEPIPDDGILQVIGGDTINVRYTDDNTKTGESDVVREEQVEVVSTATATFTDGTYESDAKAAYTGHVADVLVVDVDKDVSDQQESLRVTIQARYQSFEDEAEETDYLSGAVELQKEAGPRWEIRDEVEIQLLEQSTDEEGASYHSGRFVGQVQIDELRSGQEAVASDNILSCVQQDELVVTYVDDLHINGAFERIVNDTVTVVGPWKGGLEKSNTQVPDPITQSRKAVSEAEAFLALAQIFQSMGLKEGANQNVLEGLERVDKVIYSKADISDDIRQQAFKLKWEMHLAVGELEQAIQTCQMFSQFFPESRYADEALIGIGKIHLENEAYEEAIVVFKQILELPESDVKAEAQYQIAKATEASTGQLEPAIPAYQAVADRYPDSEYTGEALAKLVNYHIETQDFVTANNLLSIIFEEHPDKQWLDGMLFRWIVLAVRMGDFRLAYDKAQQFAFEYPDSPYAPKVIGVMKKIEPKLKKKNQSSD